VNGLLNINIRHCWEDGEKTIQFVATESDELPLISDRGEKIVGKLTYEFVPNSLSFEMISRIKETVDEISENLIEIERAVA